MLPAPISSRLKAGEEQIAEPVDNVVVLFADIVGFTPLVAELKPDDLVNILSQIFSHFDAICSKHGLEKIKTIGDAYMAVAGAPDPINEPTLRSARAAVEMLKDFSLDASSISENAPRVKLEFRIGMHVGPAVAGVIGKQRLAYDLWGDAVNVAARMESHGMPSRIHVSEEFVKQLQAELAAAGVPEEFRLEERGTIEIKGRGPMRTYFVD